MEELLLNLICEEQEVSEEYLFSKFRYKNITESFSMMTHILHVKKGIKMSSIFKFYKKKGFKKKRSTLYNYIRSADKSLHKDSYYITVYTCILQELNSAESEGVFIMNSTHHHVVLGRVLQKIAKVDRLKHLNKIEKSVDSILKAEFIKIGKYEEETLEIQEG
jgi:hypothetical protein